MFRWTSYMSISKENKLSPMFECWTADRVWISFLFLTTWKLSHLIKTKFIENEKRVLKKKTSKKKKEKEKKRNLFPTRFELAPLDEKDRMTNWINQLDHASKRRNFGVKKVPIPSQQWLTVFRIKFLGFFIQLWNI